MRERIGSYRIERVLAEGGMGLVYKGRHETLGRDAAIKTLLPKDAGDAALRQRLLREAQAQARLQHPNIVAVYDLIDDKGELFIAMEYIEGETLAAMLDGRPRSRMTVGEALPLFEQVLDALEYVHDEKIVHRDVKPSNVMVCGSRAKLADFGIALLTETPRITASLQLIGSPPYMSPEQLEARSVDHRTDIYSAALVFYRMVAGRPPFEAKEYLAQVHERAIGPPELRTLVPELPAGLCDAVAIALRHDPNQRFRSVAAFRDSLREGAAGFLVMEPQAIDDATIVSAPATTEPLEIAPEPESHKPTILVLVVIAGTFFAALAVLVQQVDRQPLPAHPPRQNIASISANQLPIVIETPAPPVEQPKPAPPQAGAPQKDEPFVVTTTTESEEDKEARLRRGIDALRDDIRRGFARAENQLELEQFDTAIEELDRIAVLAQRHPDDFWQERDAITRLRARVIEAQVAAQTRKAQDALWASRLAEVEEDLRAGRWPEAERFAKSIAEDARAPEPIAARARALLQQAKDGRKNAFKDMQLGTTTNTIRKPSSPPRKEL